jgi:hypothetical protein
MPMQQHLKQGELFQVILELNQQLILSIVVIHLQVRLVIAHLIRLLKPIEYQQPIVLRIIRFLLIVQQV